MIAIRSPWAKRRRIQAPVFVVGCCNSGTTILWRALLEHPELTGPLCEGQDLRDLPIAMRHFLGSQTFRMFAHPRFRDSYVLTERHYDDGVADRLDAVYADHTRHGTRFVEKSPANSQRTRFLASVYSDATFVMIIRRGLAVSEGIVRKRTCDPERPQIPSQKTRLEDAALQWACSNARMLSDRRFLQRSILITYEDLVASPTTTLSRVFRFSGLSDFDMPMPMFEADHNERQISRLTLDQGRLAIAAMERGLRMSRAEPAIRQLLRGHQ